MREPSARTAAKRRRAQDLAPLIVPLREGGATLQAIADALNSSGHSTPRGCDWSPSAVREVLLTLDDIRRSEEAGQVDERKPRRGPVR